MFVRVFLDSIQFSAENQILPMEGELDTTCRWIHFVQFNTPEILEFTSRIAEQEDIWILEDFANDATLNGSVPSFIRNHAIIGQVKSLHYLRTLYKAEEREAMLAVLHDDLDSSPSQVYRDSTLFFSRWWNTYDPTWASLRSMALAYLTQEQSLSEIPYLQALGYSDEIARDIDASIPEYVSMQTRVFVEGEAVTKSLVAHVNVAIACALDTPQVITISVGTRNIVIQNKRVSAHIRGLHIELPTGGFVFYRDASYKDGSLHFDGRRVANRSPTLAIVNAVAFDFLWSVRGIAIGLTLTDGLADAKAFASSAIPSANGGTRPA